MNLRRHDEKLEIFIRAVVGYNLCQHKKSRAKELHGFKS